MTRFEKVLFVAVFLLAALAVPGAGQVTDTATVTVYVEADLTQTISPRRVQGAPGDTLTFSSTWMDGVSGDTILVDETWEVRGNSAIIDPQTGFATLQGRGRVNVITILNSILVIIEP